MDLRPRPSGKLAKFLDLRVSLLALTAGAAYFLQAVFSEFNLATWLRSTALGVGTTLTALTVWVNQINRKRRVKRLADAEELAKQARRETTAATRSAIEPGIDMLVGIAAQRRVAVRRTMAEHLKQLVVGIACDLKPSCRASYFKYDSSGPKRVLQWERIWKPGADRPHPPRERFEEGDKGPGDEMFRMMDGKKGPGDGSTRSYAPFFVEDVSQLEFHLRREPRDYETYIAAPVILNGKKFGFLGVDAPKAGDLTSEEVNMMRILSKVLAVGLSMSSRPSPLPDTKAGPTVPVS